MQRSLEEAHAHAAETERKLADLMKRDASASFQPQLPSSSTATPTLNDQNGIDRCQPLLATIKDSVQDRSAKQPTPAAPCLNYAIQDQIAGQLGKRVFEQLSKQLVPALVKATRAAVQGQPHEQLDEQFPPQLSNHVEPALKESVSERGEEPSTVKQSPHAAELSAGLQVLDAVKQLDTAQQAANEAHQQERETQRQCMERLQSTIEELKVFPENCLCCQHDVVRSPALLHSA